ncbi:MAG TPA: hypothetical protein VF263_03600 [Longimicrobiaceae bacterium]
MRPTALVLLLTLLLNGCFNWVPAPSAPARTARVRVVLATPADFRLTDYTANEVAIVEGEMVEGDGDRLVISAIQLLARSGYEFPGKGETLEIPRAAVASIQTRRVSAVRTGLLAAAVVAVMTVTGRVVSGGTEGGGGGGGGPPVQH